MMPAYVSHLGNHLWQSTLFAAAVAAFTFLLKKNRAHVRYWLWFSASLKFAIPFSLLIALGSHLNFSRPGIALKTPPPQFPVVMRTVFVPAKPVVQPETRPQKIRAIPALLLSMWGCGFSVVLLSWWRQWRRIRKALRAATPLDFETRIQALSSPERLEPGVFGIWRPVLLLPEGITDRLTPAQVDAIVTHELCHVRRRDNLAAAMHMAIEAVFWFYPLVWWIGRQIVEERERTCDEEVLQLGNEPQPYAESILKVCEFYLESPLRCTSGVTGANLRKRIRAIITNRAAKKLHWSKKLLLASVAISTVIVPLWIGFVNAPQLRAQSQRGEPLRFEVASVKPNKSNSRQSGLQFLPGGRFSTLNIPLQIIIAVAYDVPFQSPRLSGGPDWIRSERYDIEATPEKDAIPSGTTVKLRKQKIELMLQTLLQDRFKLKMRREMVEQPVYAAVVAKNGPRLQNAKIEEKDCSYEPGQGGIVCHQLTGGQGRGLHGQAVDMSDLVGFVANWTDRPVIDKTGLEGLYDIETEGWVPLRPRMPLPPGAKPSEEDLAFADPGRPTLFMIFDRLGLKLESQKAPVETFVIEHVERPTEN